MGSNPSIIDMPWLALRLRRISAIYFFLWLSHKIWLGKSGPLVLFQSCLYSYPRLTWDGALCFIAPCLKSEGYNRRARSVDRGTYIMEIPILIRYALRVMRCTKEPIVLVLKALGKHPFPSRTRSFSPAASMILGPQGPGKVDQCQNHGLFVYPFIRYTV